jgi:hypothetical protein
MPAHLRKPRTFTYINSFTVTQKKTFGTMGRLTGDKFEVTNVRAEEVSKIRLEKPKSTSEFVVQGHGSYAVGSFKAITTAICRYTGFNNFSKTCGL